MQDGSNLNEASITLNSSIDFVLQPANLATDLTTIFSDFAISNIALYNLIFTVRAIFRRFVQISTGVE